MLERRNFIVIHRPENNRSVHFACTNCVHSWYYEQGRSTCLACRVVVNTATFVQVDVPDNMMVCSTLFHRADNTYAWCDGRRSRTSPSPFCREHAGVVIGSEDADEAHTDLAADRQQEQEQEQVQEPEPMDYAADREAQQRAQIEQLLAEREALQARLQAESRARVQAETRAGLEAEARARVEAEGQGQTQTQAEPERYNLPDAEMEVHVRALYARAIRIEGMRLEEMMNARQMAQRERDAAELRAQRERDAARMRAQRIQNAVEREDIQARAHEMYVARTIRSRQQRNRVQQQFPDMDAMTMDELTAEFVRLWEQDDS